MGRKRATTAEQQLPKYVYIRRGWYVYRPHVGKGKLGKDIKLCPADAPLSEVWARYESVTAKGAPRTTLAWVIDQYMGSKQYAGRATKTRFDYASAAEHFKAYALKNGGAFGDVDANKITPGVIRRYLDARADSPVSANRSVSFLSVCFAWAVERDLLKNNPCVGVRRYSEVPRKRYVTEAEYKAVYELAGAHGWRHVQCAMELAYLCRMRLCEVLGMTYRDIRDDGVHVRRRKGSRDNLVTWTPRLMAVVEQAKALPMPQARPIDPPLIRGIGGSRLTESGFQTLWQRLMAEAVANGMERFTFHDLKSAGVSDTKGDKQAASGHKTAAMVSRYDRKLAEVKPAGDE